MYRSKITAIPTWDVDQDLDGDSGVHYRAARCPQDAAAGTFLKHHAERTATVVKTAAEKPTAESTAAKIKKGARLLQLTFGIGGRP